MNGMRAKLLEKLLELFSSMDSGDDKPEGGLPPELAGAKPEGAELEIALGKAPLEGEEEKPAMPGMKGKF